MMNKLFKARKTLILMLAAAMMFTVPGIYMKVMAADKVHTITVDKAISGTAGTTETKYKVTVPETGIYYIKFTNQSAGIRVGIGNGGSISYNYVYDNGVREYKFESGKEYTVYVSARDSETATYNMVLTKNIWKEISLNDTKTISNTGYYKYTSNKSGIYSMADENGVGTYRWDGIVIYDGNMKQIYQLSQNTLVYFQKGKTYYIKASFWRNTDEEVKMKRKFTLKRIEERQCDKNTIAAGKGSGNIFWEIDGTGTLNITGTGVFEELPMNNSDGYMDKIKKIVVSKGVTEIGDYALRDLSKVKSIELPDNLQTIGKYAFANCSGIKKIELPKKLKTIENDAFDGCIGLKKISIPANVRKVGNYAFWNCSSLSEIEIPVNNKIEVVGYDIFKKTAWMEKQKSGFISKTGILFEYNGTEKKTAIPDDINTIGMYAFYENNTLESIAVSSNLKKINDYGFANCEKLNNITVPGSVSDVAYCSFEGCTALENVVLEEGVKSVKKAAFQHCDTLNEITIPKSVTEIGDYAIGYYLETDYEKEDYLEMKKAENLPTIRCYKDSAAYSYAIDNDIPYLLIDEQDMTNSFKKTVRTMCVGEKFQSEIVAGDGKVISQSGITWTSSNAKVATVSSTGKVTAKKAGRVIITATVGTQKATCKITVKPAPKKITLNKKTLKLKKEKSVQIKYTITKGSFTKVTFSSSNKKVATVDSKGKVVAMKNGTAVITVRTLNGKIAKCKVTVVK